MNEREDRNEWFMEWVKSNDIILFDWVNGINEKLKIMEWIVMSKKNIIIL